MKSENRNCEYLISILAVGVFLSIVPDGLAQNCGLERWAIKTLSDIDTVKINFNQKIHSTVETQVKMLPPGRRHYSRMDTELEVLSLDCFIVGYKRSIDDMDIHIILEDILTDATMVAEIPSHTCIDIQKTSRYILFKDLENWFIQNIGYPQTNFTYLEKHIPVTVTGIGFFDSHHGQIGMAGNGREIHPVLSLELR